MHFNLITKGKIIMNDMFKVIGIEHRSYVSKKTGKDVEGYNLYLSHETNDSSVIGVRCFTEWLQPDMFSDDIVVGCEVSLVYNRFGRLTGVTVF